MEDYKKQAEQILESIGGYSVDEIAIALYEARQEGYSAGYEDGSHGREAFQGWIRDAGLSDGD